MRKAICTVNPSLRAVGLTNYELINSILIRRKKHFNKIPIDWAELEASIANNDNYPLLTVDHRYRLLRNKLEDLNLESSHYTAELRALCDYLDY